MKNYSYLAVYSIFLLAFSCLTACAPQIAGERVSPLEEAAPHTITVYENNHFKEEKLAFEFPEEMRYREDRVKLDNDEIVSQMVPVTRIEILLVGKDGKLTTRDNAVRIVINDYAADGKWLQCTHMLRKSSP